jgi:hypothetical protein
MASPQLDMDEFDQDDAETIDVQDVPEELPERPIEYITLRMRETNPEMGAEDVNRNLDYGPASKRAHDHSHRNITFYNFMAVTRADHPLLDEVLRKFPVEIVVQEEKERIYLDGETGKEYKSKKAFLAAQRAKKSARKS